MVVAILGRDASLFYTSRVARYGVVTGRFLSPRRGSPIVGAILRGLTAPAKRLWPFGPEEHRASGMRPGGPVSIWPGP